LLIKDRKLMVYLPAGRQVPKLGYVRAVGTAADKRYVDEDLFCCQHSRKPLVSGMWRLVNIPLHNSGKEEKDADEMAN